KVDVEVQALTESEDDLAFHDAARCARVADRAEEDGLVFAQRLDVGPRDVRAEFRITRRGPGIFLARCGKAEAFLGRVEDTKCSVGHFRADAVAGDDGNGVGTWH